MAASDILSLTQLEAILGRSMDPDEATSAELYIENAVGEIEAWLGRPVTPTEFVDEEHFPDNNGTIYFTTTPVISLDELSVDGEAQDLDYFTVTKYGIEGVWDVIDFSPGPIDIAGSLTGEPVILVSYTAGYPIGGPLFIAVRSLVTNGVVGMLSERGAFMSRTSNSSHGARRIAVEDFEVDYGSSDSHASSSTGASGGAVARIFSDSALSSIKRYKRRGFA